MEEREAGSAYPSIGARVRLSIGYQNKERRESPCHESECEEKEREREWSERTGHGVCKPSKWTGRAGWKASI